MRPLLLLFIIVPIVEMVILIEVGGIIGALPTVALVVLTAMAGIWLLRWQGLATLARMQDKLARNEIPDTELLEGVMLLIGGALLLTPGFVTDAIGFCCLLPGTRRPLARWTLRQGVLRAIQTGGTTWRRHSHHEFRSNRHRTIEGDYKEEDDR